tara:strand:- start:566 stop:775 length:210 start_codon:yes stop_codon:yes gene_type:complete
MGDPKVFCNCSSVEISMMSSTGPISNGPAIAPMLSNTFSALPTLNQPPLPVLQEIIEELPCFSPMSQFI